MTEFMSVEKNKSTTSISVKVFFDQEFRRFSVSGKTTYNELCELLQQIFNIDMKENKFTLRYKDDEEEFVLFSSDLELDEALSFAKQSNPPILRLFLTKDYKEVEIEEEEEEEEKEEEEEEEKEKENEEEEKEEEEKKKKKKKTLNNAKDLEEDLGVVLE